VVGSAGGSALFCFCKRQAANACVELSKRKGEEKEAESERRGSFVDNSFAAQAAPVAGASTQADLDYEKFLANDGKAD
jgi:hypothetical protein